MYEVAPAILFGVNRPPQAAVPRIDCRGRRGGSRRLGEGTAIVQAGEVPVRPGPTRHLLKRLTGGWIVLGPESKGDPAVGRLLAEKQRDPVCVGGSVAGG